MKVAYVDSSCLIAIAFEERGSRELARLMERFDRLLSSNLLEAEFLAALARESIGGGDELLSWITWIFPDRSLSPEIARALRAGYSRGADLWHLATALYATETPSEIPFLTLDTRQQELAEKLGFPRA